MKRKLKFTIEHKDAAIAALDAGMPVKEVEAKFGMSNPSIYTWRKKRRQERAGKTLPGKALKTTTKAGSVPVEAVHAMALQHAVRDATLLLRKSKSELIKGLRNGTIEDLDQPHLLALLALSALQGGS